MTGALVAALILLFGFMMGVVVTLIYFMMTSSSDEAIETLNGRELTENSVYFKPGTYQVTADGSGLSIDPIEDK